MTQTLESFVRAIHPCRVVEPLDATTPSDVVLDRPTVIIEVMGARDALDALARVRRLVDGAPIAAVRLAPGDPCRERSADRSTAVLLHALVAALGGVAVVAFLVAASGGLLRNVLGADRIDNAVEAAMLIVAAVTLAGMAMLGSRRWWRDRRLPVERRRYRERRRESAVIAVPVVDDRTAARLAAAIRRALGDVTPAGVPCTVTVHRPADEHGPDVSTGG